MHRMLEYVLSTYPVDLLKARPDVSGLCSPYLAHCTLDHRASVTAASCVWADQLGVAFGFADGRVSLLGLNRLVPNELFAAQTPSGALAPPAVRDVAPLGQGLAVACGPALYKLDLRTGDSTKIPLKANAASVGGLADDSFTLAIGLETGDVALLDLRTPGTTVLRPGRSRSLRVVQDTVGDFRQWRPLCVKRNVCRSHEYVMCAPGIKCPLQVWDLRASELLHQLFFPPYYAAEDEGAVWLAINRSRVAVTTTKDIVLIYDHKAEYQLDFYTQVSTRQNVRCTWVDEDRLITGVYGPMREGDQRGFPMITVPERQGDTGAARTIEDLPWQWINCPFQSGLTATCPFSSYGLDTVSTSYGVVMEHSVCIIDERYQPIDRALSGALDNAYQSRFSCFGNGPLGHPQQPPLTHSFLTAQFRGALLERLDQILYRRGIPFSLGLIPAPASVMLSNLYRSLSGTYSLASAPSQLDSSANRYIPQEFHCFSQLVQSLNQSSMGDLSCDAPLLVTDGLPSMAPGDFLHQQHPFESPEASGAGNDPPMQLEDL
ncbi:hypothetical protein GMRT_15064 [Giardia muris]|uniref:Uncharacterized protein n=1 Tax=Giardia muris TaxID=5742 RepID=A0A4Z1T1U3_GIAMU|nr:hypothetical protein GMRT_15064 [Giardia muris]|eukprot:TNJ26937.1 hypothetical protein GMRT_15064 [Giardia muris]